MKNESRDCSDGGRSDCDSERGGSRESADAWQTVKHFAEQALQQAIEATTQAAGGDYIQADKVANDASERLKARSVLTFAEHRGP